MTANNAIAERLRATLAKELKQDVKSITPEHTLRGDLGLNSLDAIELMFRIEEEFDLSIPDDDIQGLVKVGDVIDYLERRLTPAAATAHATPSATAPRPSPAATTTRPPSAAKAPAKKAKAKASRRHA